MTICLSKDLHGYFDDPITNDGLTINHVSKEDLESIKAFLEKYSIEFKIFRENEDLDNIEFIEEVDLDYDSNESEVAENSSEVIENSSEIIEETEEEVKQEIEETKEIKSKPKKIHINNGKETKFILETELKMYIQNGWEVGKKK